VKTKLDSLFIFISEHILFIYLFYVQSNICLGYVKKHVLLFHRVNLDSKGCF